MTSRVHSRKREDPGHEVGISMRSNYRRKKNDDLNPKWPMECLFDYLGDTTNAYDVG